MLLKRAIQSASPCKNQYLSNLFLVSKRDGGNRPVINLKHLNNFIPYQHFKKEGLNLLQNMLQKRLHVPAGSKRRLLLCSSKKGIKEICTVLVGRDTLLVPLSLFWSRSIVFNIYQNFKGTNFPPEKASETCDNIYGRHFTEVTDTGRVNGQRYNNFS